MKFKISDKLKRPVLIAVLLLSILVLLFMRQLILVIGLFFFCLIFMFKFGAHIVFDFDPVPFSSLILLHVYNPITSLIFVLLTIPIIDIIVGRLSHFSLINLFSIIVTILLFMHLPNALIYGIIIFNLIRIVITVVLNLGLDSALFSIIHMILYFILGALLSFFI